uniref:Uncharacterized protein n=1 Tax=Pristionchus pacificus TaxID=54126 RepID=A0A2A6BWP0_PRIPA|eukprot:PDM70256.1 hypothetical protein PRIPAC_46502 [Pristionchus pacificus]
MFSHGYLIWFAVVDVQPLHPLIQQQVAFDRQKIEELPYRLVENDLWSVLNKQPAEFAGVRT